ncbi:MAG TPA: thioesterase family protein [Acidimicrobiales bacterium]|nr:thioesterase family protein [Acidimicrobiales bacterium]
MGPDTATPATAALPVTHTSVVTKDQIDHLGHMNVIFYAVNAQAGTRAVLDRLDSWGGRPYVVHDVYTRHHHEQMLGTSLAVRSGVLGASPAALRLHHELVAVDSGDLAATFVHAVSPVDDLGRRFPVPAEVVEATAIQAIDPPTYAATRTVSLDADLVGTAPSLEELRERGLATRQERRIAADECDERGAYRLEKAPMLTWGGVAVEGDTGGQPRETSDGRLMAWASMETRLQCVALPAVGTRIQSFGAGVAIHDKVTHRVHWAYDLDTGGLLTVFEIVSLAFDIRGRRPMSIPDDVRAMEMAWLQPDLAPRP